MLSTRTKFSCLVTVLLISSTSCFALSSISDERAVLRSPSNTRVAVMTENQLAPTAYISTDNGISWVRHPIADSKGYIRSVVCNNTQFCTAVGYRYERVGYETITHFYSYTSNDAGENWLAHKIDTVRGASALSSVTCSGTSGQNCVAVGGFSTTKSTPMPIVYTSADGGNTWLSHYPVKLGKLGSGLSAVSCRGADGKYCTVVGDFSSGYEQGNNTTTFISYTSTDGGYTWSQPNVIEKHKGVSLLKSIVCNGNEGQNCVAVGYTDRHDGIEVQPIIYRTINGGVSWDSFRPQQKIGGKLNAVTCNGNNGQYCTSVGYYLLQGGNNPQQAPIAYTSTDGGRNWVKRDVSFAELFTPFQSLEAVTCSGDDGKYCTALGHHNRPSSEAISWVSSNGGITWNRGEWGRTSYFIPPKVQAPHTVPDQSSISGQ